MNSSVEFMCYCKDLGLAPCPPPCFYPKFEEYAFNQSLIREEICEIANRCMSRYPTENSSQIIELICSPPTVPPTSPPTVPPTPPPTVPPSSESTEEPNTTYQYITTESSSTVTLSSTPFMLSATPAPHGCNATCIALVVCFLITIVVVIFVLVLIWWCRKQGVLHLNQIKWCCKKGKEDQRHLVGTKDVTVYYVKMGDDIDICIGETDGDNNVKISGKKDIHHTPDTVTERMKMQFSKILTQENVESKDSTTNIATYSYENTNFISVECDTSDPESCDDEININATTHESDTGSMITHVSSTLILDNIELNVQSETYIQVKESINTDATEPSSLPRDNTDEVEEKDDVPAKDLDLTSKIDSDGEKGNDKKEADVEQGPSIDIDNNKKHTSDTPYLKSDEAEVQRKKTAGDHMNIGPGGENREILKEDERISKSVPTETVIDAKSQENVDGEDVELIDEQEI